VAAACEATALCEVVAAVGCSLIALILVVEAIG